MTTQPQISAAPSTEPSTARVVRLGLEFFALFGIGPALWALGFVKPNLFLVLALLAGGSAFLLIRDRSFDRMRLWNFAAAKAELPAILKRFAVLSIALTAIVAILTPDILFRFPLERPLLWLMVCVLYPIFSVFPQTLIYRTFLFHRYADLFPTATMRIIASTVAFGFAHVILHNQLAVILTAFGGFLFARTYQRTNSSLASAIEHALYGTMVFTIGLGASFLVTGFR